MANLITLILSLVAMFTVWVFASGFIGHTVAGRWGGSTIYAFALGINALSFTLLEPSTHALMAITAAVACIWGFKNYWEPLNG